MSLIKKVVWLPMIVAIIVGGLLGFTLGTWRLQPQITMAQSQLDSLDTSLVAAQAAYVSASLRDPRLTSYAFHSIQGVVINFGNETAVNILITVKWFKDGA